jgi:hypothetical protein
MQQLPEDIIIEDKKKSDRVLEIRTTQTCAFKKIIKNMSKFVSDCCLVFISQDKKIMDNMINETGQINVGCPISSGKPEPPVWKPKLEKIMDNTINKTGFTGIRILRMSEDKSNFSKLCLQN